MCDWIFYTKTRYSLSCYYYYNIRRDSKGVSKGCVAEGSILDQSRSRMILIQTTYLSYSAYPVRVANQSL